MKKVILLLTAIAPAINKTAEKLNAKLSSGIVTFTYRKSDGSIRYAVGTTNATLIPADKQAKPGANFATATNQRYFDFLKGDYRTCKKSDIIRITATVLAQ